MKNVTLALLTETLLSWAAYSYSDAGPSGRAVQLRRLWFPMRKPVSGHLLLHRPKSLSDLDFKLHTSCPQLQDGAILLFLTFPARKQKGKACFALRTHFAKPQRTEREDALRGWSNIVVTSSPYLALTFLLSDTLPYIHGPTGDTTLSFLQSLLLRPSEWLGLSLQHHQACGSPVLLFFGASCIGNC